MGRTTKTKDKVKLHKTIESRTDFFYYMFRNVLLFGIPLLIISGLVLSHLSFHSSATSPDTDSLAITISSSCTLSSTVNIPHSAEVFNGNYETNIGKTTVKTLCNDGNGYSIYTNGFSNNEEGNNKLINSSHPQYSIDTGLASSGLTSTWAMKLNNIPDDPSPTPPVIEQDYNNTYGIVPTYWTKVASRPSGTTDMSQGSSFTTTYSVYASSSQYTGTYIRQVKYLLTHPYNNTKVIYNNMEMAFIQAGKEKIILDENHSYFAMQDMTSDICDEVSVHNEASRTQLIDIRDNQVYWVAKLDDEHCWMTQNLDFNILADKQDSTKMKTLTSEDTDLTDHSLNGIYSGGYSYDYTTGITTWTPSVTAKTINFKDTTMTGWQDSNNKPYSANKIDGDNLGNYYNWAAAIASNNYSNLVVQYGIVNNSICPRGWRLPIATNDDETIYEFGNLLYTYDIATAKTGNNIRYKTNGFQNILKSPLWFTLAGYIQRGSLLSIQQFGYYWSSVAGDPDRAYILNFSSTSASPARNNSGYDNSLGFSVRCLAR